MSNQQSPNPSFWQKLGRAFYNLVRLVLILAIVAGIIAAGYYGIPYLYEKFILPVETNTERLTEVESNLSAEINKLAEQITGLESRLAEMEDQQVRNAQEMVELGGQIDVLDSIIESYVESIEQLAAMQTQIDELVADSARYEDLLLGEDSPITALQHQVTVTRAIELLSRSRLYLIQSNYGLARQDIQAARDLLFAVKPEMEVEKAEQVQTVINRLDLALGNLPAFPVLAMTDVDVAWQSLVYGLSYHPIEMPTPAPIMPTPTPELEGETPMPEEEEATQEPEEETPTPTATP